MDPAGWVLVWPKESGLCLHYLLLLICNANCACEWNLCIAFVMQEKCAKNKVNHKTEVKCSFTKGLDLGPILPIDTAWYGYYCFLCIPIIRNYVPLISSCTEMWNVMETNLIAWCLVGSNLSRLHWFMFLCCFSWSIQVALMHNCFYVDGQLGIKYMWMLIIIA